MALTKENIITRLAEDCDLPKAKAKAVVESVLEAMKEQLQQGDEVLISGFGKFVVSNKAARKGRNPSTGDSMILPARKVVNFKVSGVLRDSMNK